MRGKLINPFDALYQSHPVNQFSVVLDHEESHKRSENECNNTD